MNGFVKRLAAAALTFIFALPAAASAAAALGTEAPSPVALHGKVFMPVDEFIEKLKDVERHKTLYVNGCFGAPMNAENKERYKHNTAYNEQPERQAKIDAASEDTFGFDCCCLIKGVLWGWNGNLKHVYGGAKYNTGGVPDSDTEGIIDACSGVSTDFSGIVPGEAVWIHGHIGVYIGGGQVIECTPAWSDGVQYTNIENLGYTSGHSRSWVKHGKMPWVCYENKVKHKITFTVNGEFYTSAELSAGDAIKTPRYAVPAGGVFSGWEIPAAMPDNDITLDAKLSFTVGDVDFSGEADNLDASVILQYDAGAADFTDTQLKVGDADLSGGTDNLDASLILQYDAGVIERLGAEG